MKKNTVFFVLFFSILLFSATAQGISPSPLKPVADGIFGASEYAWTAPYSDMRLGVSLSSDSKTLYLCLEAPTTGWVSVGIGSLVMNGAFIVIGENADGKAVISEETGAGHGHKPNAVKRLTAGAVGENGGKTVLEFALPSAGFIDGPTLQLIMAWSATDNLAVRHSNHASVALPLLKK